MNGTRIGRASGPRLLPSVLNLGSRVSAGVRFVATAYFYQSQSGNASSKFPVELLFQLTARASTVRIARAFVPRKNSRRLAAEGASESARRVRYARFFPLPDWSVPAKLAEEVHIKAATFNDAFKCAN